MEDVHIIPNEDNNSPKNGPGKVALFLILGAILGTSAVGGAYYLGRESVQGAKTEYIEPTIAETIAEPTVTLAPTEDPSTTPPISTSSSNLKITLTPTTFGKSVSLSAKQFLSGSVGSSGNPSSVNELKMGRDGTSVYRGFTAFDLSTLSQGIVIKKATLRLYQVSLTGKPFTQLGQLKVDHLTYGDTLETEDYAAPALSSSFISIPSTEKEGWKEVDVTNRVKTDISNARSLSQFRIHFTTEKISGSGTEDLAIFGLNGVTAPQLLITY